MMTRTTDMPQTGGTLLNKAGKGNYQTQDSIKNVIRYIARENGMSKDDLICRGAMGATDFTSIDMTIRQFRCVQLLHERKGNFGRYIDHEIYSFSEEAQEAIYENDIPVEKIARSMAQDFYDDGFQVYYGVHRPDETEKHLHVHFAVNTVNFKAGKKRHENKTATKKRQERLDRIVMAEIINRQKSAKNPS